jgi:hypothetical protein
MRLKIYLEEKELSAAYKKDKEKLRKIFQKKGSKPLHSQDYMDKAHQKYMEQDDPEKYKKGGK